MPDLLSLVHDGPQAFGPQDPGLFGEPLQRGLGGAQGLTRPDGLLCVRQPAGQLLGQVRPPHTGVLQAFCRVPTRTDRRRAQLAADLLDVLGQFTQFGDGGTGLPQRPHLAQFAVRRQPARCRGEQEPGLVPGRLGAFVGGRGGGRLGTQSTQLGVGPTDPVGAQRTLGRTGRARGLRGVAAVMFQGLFQERDDTVCVVTLAARRHRQFHGGTS